MIGSYLRQKTSLEPATVQDRLSAHVQLYVAGTRALVFACTPLGYAVVTLPHIATRIGSNAQADTLTECNNLLHSYGLHLHRRS